jgi:hypothetical protein
MKRNSVNEDALNRLDVPQQKFIRNVFCLYYSVNYGDVEGLWMSKYLKAIQGLGPMATWSKYQIVSRYPLCDEPEWFRMEGENSLKMSLIADVHWVYNKQRYLVTVSAVGIAPVIPRVIFLRRLPAKWSFSAFTVLTRVRPIYTTTVEVILDNLAHWLNKQSANMEQYELGKSFTISEEEYGIKRVFGTTTPSSNP